VTWVVLVAATVIGLGLVLVPAWLIQPFKPQSPQDLQVSYWLRRLSPALTLVALAAAVLSAAALWAGCRRRAGRVVLLALPLAGLASAWLARQNHFEWMFNPLAQPSFASPGEASSVSDADMVIAVDIKGDAVAYPVRQLAYHHIVQDVVGDTPIVVTY
jgi:hypothetical protein